MFPQVTPGWQVHVWEPQGVAIGCLACLSTGTTKPISIELAALLRCMTGAVSLDELARQQPLDTLAPDAARAALADMLAPLTAEGIVESFATAQPARFYPDPVTCAHWLTILQVQLTNQCNLRCVHCYAESGAHADPGLPLQTIKDLIDAFVALGGIKLFLTGGEALTRPDLEQIIAYAKSRHLFVYLSTNGYAVTPEKAERLARLGVGAVNLSLDGVDAATHDAFRQRSGSFDKVLQAVDSFLGLHVTCAVQTTLHRNNLDQSGAIFSMMKPKGVANCYFVPMMPQGRAAQHADLVPTRDEYRPALRDYYLTRRIYEGTSIYPRTSDDSVPKQRCTAAINQLYVRADGSCYPCPALDSDELRLGRYPEMSLAALWTQASGPLAALRGFDPKSIAQCRQCDHLTVCKGGCAGNALHFHGDWTQADPHACVTMDVRRDVDALPLPEAPAAAG